MPQPDKKKHVPGGLHLKARFFRATSPIWRSLERIESAVLRDDIERTPIDRPIYICGVPRAGSTLMTELLAAHPDVTSHRYADFPNVYTPFWRNWLASRANRAAPDPVERAHRDRILVTTESPEAVEEVIWMRFFEHLHDPTQDQVLDQDTSNPPFEHRYRDHIRKLLLVRQRSRYLAKGNYNTSRLGYIRKLFPDARFIIPVRNPVNQVASLVKQDRLFTSAQAEDPRVTSQLHLSGHFEFGPGRRAVRIGRSTDADRIAEYWSQGQSVRGWALYWSSIYRHVLDQLEQDEALASSVLFLRYEDLCHSPEQTIRQVLEHARLDADRAAELIADYSGRISEPAYYSPDFSDDEMDALHQETQSTARRLGYDHEKEAH